MGRLFFIGMLLFPLLGAGRVMAHDKAGKNFPGKSGLPELIWEVGYASSADDVPDRFVPAKVPGAVQLDIARADEYPDYHYADNYKLFGWMEDKFYTYRTSFAMPALKAGQRLWFVSKGIDYEFDILLNGEVIHSQEGMFTYVELDLTDRLTSYNILEIKVMPVPKTVPYPSDRSQASAFAKPPVSYGWDWHPRLVPLGIWDDTYIEARMESYLEDVYVDYDLSDSFDSAEISVMVLAAVSGEAKYSWTLKDARGKTVASASGNMEPGMKVSYTLGKPNLWWSHDHGEPYLYESEFLLLDSRGMAIDSRKSKVGFRRVRLIMNEGGWADDDFPKGPSVSPIQLELNGRPVFAKGTNWVNPEIFPGTITAERYRELLLPAVEANFNMLRVWGGGIVNKEPFYDLCDSLGLMVWTEFPLACNDYPDDPHYISVLEREAVSIIKRVRKHPSQALWCGGNELFNSWSGMTSQSLPLRMLDRLCYEYDRMTPFLPTSPVYGMGHGCYVFRWEGTEVFEIMQRPQTRKTAYTEFGMPGISPVEVLERAIPADEMFPPAPGTAWETHHAYMAWVGNTWLCDDLLEEYFGKARNITELIGQSTLLQCEGYKAIYEEARRQKPYCSMALNWCYNDVWSTAVNNSLIAYPAVRKPAFYAVAASCRPVCASARYRKFVWHEGEYFEAELWLLNDVFTDKALPGVRITASLVCGSESVKVLEWETPPITSNTNIYGPTARLLLPAWDSDRFILRLEVEGHPEYDSEYTLLYRKKPSAGGSGGTATMNIN